MPEERHHALFAADRPDDEMNRLQKKCLIATAGFHLLLLVILLVGPAFFAPKPKVDETQVLDVIPANILDDALNSGVRGAQPPPPAPAPAVTPPPHQHLCQNLLSHLCPNRNPRRLKSSRNRRNY
jgi:hypothetical protein